MVRRIPVLTVLALSFALAATECGGAKSAHCENDGQCEALGGKFQYCVAGRCAECVTNAGCGAHGRCERGQCSAPGDTEASK
jgi:hypothetical protein